MTHTPGPWSTCNKGCPCGQISWEHGPIAKVEIGEWGDEIDRGARDLREMCGDDEETYQQAFDEMKRSGRVWIGGGGAPMFYVTRA